MLLMDKGLLNSGDGRTEVEPRFHKADSPLVENLQDQHKRRPTLKCR